MKVSHHVAVERIDRVVWIAQKIGWGEQILETVDNERFSRYCLTSTGVVLVKAYNSDTLITAYVATIGQVYAMHKACGISHIPWYLENKVKKNQQLRRSFQLASS